MLGSGFEMRHAVLLELGLEATDPAPGGVLPAVVGEQLLGRLKLADRYPVHFDDRRRRGTAEEIRAHDEAGVVIQEGDEVGVPAAEPEGEDVRLPHLIGRGPLEETWPGEVALLGRSGLRHQLRRVQVPAHRFRAGR